MGRLKTTRGKGMDLDSKSKKTQRRQQREKNPNRHWSPRYSQWVWAHFWRAPSEQPEPQLNLCLAVKAPLFRALLFSLVTPWLPLNHFQQQPNHDRTEPRVNLFSGLAVLGAKQKRCDGRVTLYLLIDQMARITDLCKPRASFLPHLTAAGGNQIKGSA